jgi:hypothetical protein
MEKDMEKEVQKEEELNLDDLDAVAGGALRHAKKEQTNAIDSNTIGKV